MTFCGVLVSRINIGFTYIPKYFLYKNPLFVVKIVLRYFFNFFICRIGGLDG